VSKPELRIVNSLRCVTAPVLVDTHFVLSIPTLTGNVFKRVNVNLKCIFIIMIIYKLFKQEAEI